MFTVDSSQDPCCHGRRRYPWRQMAPGDSFFVPAHSAPERATIRNAAKVYKRRHPGWAYLTRTSKDPRNPGIWIWRV